MVNKGGTNIMSIYQFIQQHLTANGTLPEDFSLPKKTEPGKLTFADGAIDGMTTYHISPSEHDIEPLCTIVKLISDGQEQEAEKSLDKFFSAEQFDTMLCYIDALQSWIYDNRESFAADNLYQFSCDILTSSDQPETIKFALSILELLDTYHDEPLREIIMTLAASDEFTLFCLFVVNDWPDVNERMFTMAQNVQGWGRIHAVDRLNPDTAPIKEWLLTEGWRNTVLSEYSAITCIEKGHLLEKLQQEASCPYADELIQTALEGGLVASLSAYSEGEALILAYLNQNTTLTVNRLKTMRVITETISSSEWATKEEIIQQCQTLLDSQAAKDLLTEVVAHGKNFALAMEMGIDCSQQILEKINQDFDNAYHLVSLLLEKELYADEIIALFCQHLPLSTMATGPAIELGIGPEFTPYQQLLYIVQHLRAFPGKGETLLCCALAAPVVNCRNMALNVFEAWISNGHTLSSVLQTAVQQLSEQEMDEDIRARITQLCS